MKVALVIGHSEKSQGARNATYGVSEFEFMQKLAHDIEREWSKHNMHDEIVVVYRETYEKLPHEINALGIDLVVSLHANAYDTKARGCEMLYYHASTLGKIVAIIFQERIFGVLRTINRGIKAKHSEDRGGYLLRTTQAPCIICEPFFIDNDADLLEADVLFDTGALTNAFCDAINESLIYFERIKMNYEFITTDALLEELPDHLLLARNSNADASDRWRIYNTATKEHIPMQARTARDAIINLLKEMKDE